MTNDNRDTPPDSTPERWQKACAVLLGEPGATELRKCIADLAAAHREIEALRQEREALKKLAGFCVAKEARMRPHVLMRPQVFPDGDQWCALYGDDLQMGVAGFGYTPEKACAAFDRAWMGERSQTEVVKMGKLRPPEWLQGEEPSEEEIAAYNAAYKHLIRRAEAAEAELQEWRALERGGIDRPDDVWGLRREWFDIEKRAQAAEKRADHLESIVQGCGKGYHRVVKDLERLRAKLAKAREALERGLRATSAADTFTEIHEALATIDDETEKSK